MRCSGTGRAVDIRRPFSEAGSSKARSCRAETWFYSEYTAPVRAHAGDRMDGFSPCLKEIYSVTGSYCDTRIHTDRHGCGPSCARCFGANATIRIDLWRPTSDEAQKLRQSSA